MLRLLLHDCLGLISSPRCPSCGGAAPAWPSPSLCVPCEQRLALPPGGLQGDDPLLWCALASYAGPLRQLLLRQRPQPEPALLQALAAALHRCCASALPGTLLLPLPSWKRQANPLPPLLAAGLVRASAGRCRVAVGLLQRNRPVVGQHHLNRRQRLGNQQGSFHCTASGRAALWLVDDILTTGATAQAAAAALQAQGWRVQGVLCAARTPAPNPP